MVAIRPLEGLDVLSPLISTDTPALRQQVRTSEDPGALTSAGASGNPSAAAPQPTGPPGSALNRSAQGGKVPAANPQIIGGEVTIAPVAIRADANFAHADSDRPVSKRPVRDLELSTELVAAAPRSTPGTNPRSPVEVPRLTGVRLPQEAPPLLFASPPDSALIETAFTNVPTVVAGAPTVTLPSPSRTPEQAASSADVTTVMASAPPPVQPVNPPASNSAFIETASFTRVPTEIAGTPPLAQLNTQPIPNRAPVGASPLNDLPPVSASAPPLAQPVTLPAPDSALIGDALLTNPPFLSATGPQSIQPMIASEPDSARLATASNTSDPAVSALPENQPVTGSRVAAAPAEDASARVSEAVESRLSTPASASKAIAPGASIPRNETPPTNRPALKTNEHRTPVAAQLPVAPAPTPVSVPAPTPAGNQTPKPAENLSPASDAAEWLDVGTPALANFTVPPQLTPETAFGARIVEKAPEENTGEDLVVSGGSAKPAAPQPLPHADQGSREQSSRYGDSAGHDKAVPVPAATPEQPAALRSDGAVMQMPQAEPVGRESRESAPESHPARPAEVPVAAPRPTQPVRDVTLRLTSDAQQVDVKLTDRGGELHVAVQSADPVLTTDLRAGVHDLISGLEKSGFHADAWQPGESSRHASESTAGTPRGTGDQPPSQSGEDPRRQGRNAQDPDYAPPRRNRSSNADWMEQIDALIGAGKGI